MELERITLGDLIDMDIKNLGVYMHSIRTPRFLRLVQVTAGDSWGETVVVDYEDGWTRQVSRSSDEEVFIEVTKGLT